MDNTQSMKTAVLIDAENISWTYAKLILDEASKVGTVICRRIYGDWSSQSLSSWRKPIMDYSIQPIQQFQNTTGKNSSDSALIIDAMDLLHEGRYRCVCIASSDSDFTRLASRFRESEIYVVGMGEQKTPVAFRSACDKFLYLDVIMQENKQGSMDSTGKAKAAPQSADSGEAALADTGTIDSGLNKQDVIMAINDILAHESDEDGWYFMGELGNRLLAKFPDFDVRNFGYSKLTPFVKSLDLYEVKGISNPSTHVKYIYMRAK